LVQQLLGYASVKINQDTYRHHIDGFDGAARGTRWTRR
jgi:hypothetical protein